MNSQNALGSNSISGAESLRGSGNAEATLRLLAGLPAPAGLEDRVLISLHSASRSGRILNWPGILKPPENWMRTAAAAAIVFVVAGGGWGVYSRVQPNSAIPAPTHAGSAGGFSSAGAMRTPQTLNGPVVAQPVAAQPTEVKPAKKVHAQVVPMSRQKTKAVAVNKASAQPSVTLAK